VHSAVCGTACTLEALQRAGLAAREVARITVPFGPVMHSRADLLEAWGSSRAASGTRSWSWWRDAAMGDVREVVVMADGPVLITGPVEVVLPDGAACAPTGRSPRCA
jgi:hypothetical protein